MSVASDVQNALTEPHSLFIVDGVLDLTGNISVPSYKVNALYGYDEWTDMNKTIHRDANSKRAEGTFDMVFQSPEEFLTFLATMKEYRRSNLTHYCSVYCVNDMEVINAEMYVDYDPSDILPYLGQYKEYEKLTVTIKQRGSTYV